MVVYEGVTGWDSFDPRLTLLREMDWRVAEEFAGRVPPAWYDAEDAALPGISFLAFRRLKIYTHLRPSEYNVFSERTIGSERPFRGPLKPSN